MAPSTSRKLTDRADLVLRAIAGVGATRAELVAWNAANNSTLEVGTVVHVAGLSYRYIGTGTAIADLPGWVPNGIITPNHFATNTAPRTTDMLAAIQAAITYSGTFNPTTQGRPPVILLGEEYLISEPILVTKDFTVLDGPDDRSALLVAASDFGAMIVCAAPTPVTTSLNQPTIKNIGLRYYADSAALIGIKFIRCVGPKAINVDTHSLFGGILMEGGNNLVIDKWTHTFGIYSGGVVAGAFSLKTREGPAASGKVPSNIFISNSDVRSDDQDLPRMDCGFDLGSFDGIFPSNVHILGAGGKGCIYVKPEVTALSPTGSRCTWIEGNINFDGGSTYGIYVAASGAGVPEDVGNWKFSAIFSRPEVNHIFVEADSYLREVVIDALFLNAGDSGVVLEGGSHIEINGTMHASGQNGTSGKKSGVVLDNDVHHITTRLKYTNDTILTQTTGVEVLTNTVDYLDMTGSAWGMANPVTDDYSYVSGTNTGSKHYDIKSDKQTVFSTTVSAGAIQRKPYSRTVYLDSADTSDISGAIDRFADAEFTAVSRSTRWFRTGATTTSLRLAGGVDWQAVDGDTITFRYSILRGWVEICRSA